MDVGILQRGECGVILSIIEGSKSTWINSTVVGIINIHKFSYWYRPPQHIILANTQFGFLQTAVSAQQPFSSWGTVWNATYLYNSYCVANAKFGKLLPYSEPQTDYTNAIYGGLDFNADNVTFVHGSLDPWHRIGVAEGTVLRSGNVYYIEGGSHCNDATSPEYDGGSAALQRTRSNILYDIQYYLQGNPWDHHTTEDTSQASISGTKARWGGQDDACGFKIVTKRTKVTVKYGQQIKVCWTRHPMESSR